MGGDGISITSGIVSRIDWGDYSHSDERNLVVVRPPPSKRIPKLP